MGNEELEQQIKKLQLQVERLRKQIDEQLPLINQYEAFMATEGALSMNEVAKILKTGRTTLLERLREEGVLLTMGKSHNLPASHYAHHFVVKAQTAPIDDEDGFVITTTRVKPDSLVFVAEKFGCDLD